MIYQFEEFFSVEVAPYDLCIIGSGPSGITLGLELLYEGLRICTIAGGDFKESSFFRQLKEVEAPYLEVKEVSRIRAFGGTSNTWTGHLAPLDPIDRASRGGIQPGWPYEADPVTAINTRGHRYDLPQLSLFDLNDQLSLEPWPNELKGLREKIFLVQRRPLKFGVKYKYAYLRENFDLLIGAVVTSLESQQKSNKRHVTSVIVKSSGGRSKRILAKKYVLAAGCIENVRLLFSSKDEVGVALGNSYDQLGRRFINHPKADVGEVHFNHGLARAHPLFKLQRAHFRGYVGLRLEESLQETEGLLNSYLRLIPLTRRLLNLKAAVKSTFEINLRDAILSAVAALASRGSVKCARVRCFMDMEASPENRITLSDRLDSLGVAIPIVRYSVSERALNSVRALIDRFSRELSDLGIGKFKPYASFLSGLVKWEDASHHLGGTPMGEDPRTSVVNSELRLPGVYNV
jgi:choline dehydrogenase-like flavoprotein